MGRVTLALLACILAAGPVEPADCNRNGVEDGIDVAPTSPGFLRGPSIKFLPDINDFRTVSVDGTEGVSLAAIVRSELVVVSPTAAGGRFQRVSTTQLSGRPWNLVTGDLDHDGLHDFAVVSNHGVQVVWSNSQASPTAGEIVEIGSGPLDAVAADLNGDGREDVATANRIGVPEAANISVLLSGENRKLELPRHFASAPEARGIAAADIDRDGDVDLIVVGAQETSSKLGLHLNDGNGGFPDLRRQPLAFIPRGPLSAGDMDGDSDADLLVAIEGPGVGWASNDGAGSFPIGEMLDPAPAGGIVTPELLDLGGGGSPSIVALERHCGSGFLWVAGETGRIELLREWELAAGYYYKLRAGDADADGDQDLFVRSDQGIEVLNLALIGTSADCNSNGIPDECEPDCDSGSLPDDCDVALRGLPDCNLNAIPDVCEPDTDGNGVADACDIAQGTTRDCNRNGRPDAWDRPDANRNGVPDECDLAQGTSEDCDGDGIPDDAELAPTFQLDQCGVALDRSVTAFDAGDIDGDSFSDIAVCVSDVSEELLVLRSPGAPDALGEAPQRIQIDREISRALLRDFDLDGDLDLALSTRYGRCWRVDGKTGTIFLLENQSGELHARGSLSFGSGESQDLIAVDLSGDGRVDFAGSAHDGLWLLQNAGGWSFERPDRILSARFDVKTIQNMAAADFDGDGRVDVALDVGILLVQRAPAGFSAIHLPADAGPLAAGDFDGDRDVDLATTEGILANDGRATFQIGASFKSPTESLAAADWDGNGITDAAAATGWTGVLMHWIEAGELRSEAVQLATKSGLLLGAAHMSGANRWDLVGVDPDGGLVSWTRGGGRSGTRTRQPYPEIENSASVRSADVDGDGDSDLVLVQSPESRLLVFENAGGDLRMRPNLELSPDPWTLVAQDMNGDLRPDLILGATEAIEILLHTGPAAWAREWPGIPIAKAREIVPLDVNDDGNMDLLILSAGDGAVSLALQGPPGTFHVQQTRNHVSERIAKARLFRDGRPAIVLAEGRALTILSGDGHGGFQELRSIEQPGWINAFCVADLDGDGLDDVVLSLCDGSDCARVAFCDSRPILRVLTRLGDTELQSRDFPMTQNASSIAASDLDLDGDQDLAVQHGEGCGGDTVESSSALEVFLNDGAGHFTSWGIAGSLPSSTIDVVEDLDGDGYPELVISGNVFSDTGFMVLKNLSRPPRHSDADRDGRLDSCAPVSFRRGDWNQDGAVSLTDAVALLAFLFQGADPFPCKSAGDADDDGRLALTDVLRILLHLFGSGPAPPEPFERCGADSTPDVLRCRSGAACR